METHNHSPLPSLPLQQGTPETAEESRSTAKIQGHTLTELHDSTCSCVPQEQPVSSAPSTFTINERSATALNTDETGSLYLTGLEAALHDHVLQEIGVIGLAVGTPGKNWTDSHSAFLKHCHNNSPVEGVHAVSRKTLDETGHRVIIRIGHVTNADGTVIGSAMDMHRRDIKNHSFEQPLNDDEQVV